LGEGIWKAVFFTADLSLLRADVSLSKLLQLAVLESFTSKETFNLPVSNTLKIESTELHLSISIVSASAKEGCQT
jgi:hypothetical protein